MIHILAMKMLAETTLRNVLAGRDKDALIFERRGVEEAAANQMNAINSAWDLHVDKVEMKR